MEKNNQPLIITAIIGGIVLIIALALIFTRNSDETTTEAILTDDTSENQENKNGEENGEDDQQSETPDPTPDPQPTPDPEPQPEPIPEPSGGLPSNWQSLTSQEKTDLNLFDCNLETQWISAEDGTCREKVEPPADTQPIVCPDGEIGGHPHGSYFVNGECHSHPSEDEKECGETVWVHTGGSSHETYVKECPSEEQPVARRQVRGEAVTVGSGIFTGGVHIKAGLYDATILAGQSVRFFIIQRADNGLTRVYSRLGGDHAGNKMRVEIAANERIEIVEAFTTPPELLRVTFTPVDSAFVTEYKTTSLHAGAFIVGEDIAEGKYTVTLEMESDICNFWVYDWRWAKGEFAEKKVNIILGNDRSYHVPSITHDFKNGDTIEVGSLKGKIIFTPSN